MKESRRRRFVFLIACLVSILIASLAYTITRTVFLLNRPSLGVTGGSSSLADSRALGFYIGVYKPTKPRITLRDLSVVNIPDAWVEHASKPELTWYFKDEVRRSDGYFFYIPISAKGFPLKSAWPFPFALDIAESDLKYSHYPGIGYSTLGFSAYFDSLPDTISFAIKEKLHENDSWNDAITTGLIEFKRAF